MADSKVLNYHSGLETKESRNVGLCLMIRGYLGGPDQGSDFSASTSPNTKGRISKITLLDEYDCSVLLSLITHQENFL